MNDGERDSMGLSNAEEETARRLARLASLMREQEVAEAEIDQHFARNLRARLVDGTQVAPTIAAARTVDSELAQESAARPVDKPFWRRPFVWAGAAASVLAALMVSAIVALLVPRGSHAPSIAAPQPTRADLIFSFPPPQTVIHRLSPTTSLVHPRPGVPYAGRLRLSARRLPQSPAQLRAYRLAPPSNVVVAGRGLLGIHSPERQVRVNSATWVVAADGGFPSGHPLHSLAVSLATGELIYHDRRNLRLPHAREALPRSSAVTIARHWLSRLGWPGGRMPLKDVDSVPNLPKVREVKFGWIGVGRTATDAATLWVTPDKSVIEAWVWPPVMRTGTVPARSFSSAWAEVRTDKLPFAVEGVPSSIHSSGVGSLLRTAVLSILSPGSPGTLYLVPVYRFEGKAHIPGASIHTWLSFAPGERR